MANRAARAQSTGRPAGARVSTATGAPSSGVAQPMHSCVTGAVAGAGWPAWWRGIASPASWHGMAFGNGAATAGTRGRCAGSDGHACPAFSPARARQKGACPSGTRPRRRPDASLLVSGRDPNGGRPGAYHVHVESRANQARRRRPGEPERDRALRVRRLRDVAAQGDDEAAVTDRGARAGLRVFDRADVTRSAQPRTSVRDEGAARRADGGAP